MLRYLPLAQSRAPLAGALLMTGAAQVGIQALTFISGIVILRTVSPVEYAYYTILNTALGAMAVLTDSGATNAVLTQGGKVWNNREALGRVLATGLQLRRRLAILAAAIVLPALMVLLHRQGASWLLALGLCLSCLPLFALTISTQMLDVIPKLHQELAPLQRIQLLANAARTLLLAAIMRALPFASAASLIAAVPQGWLNWQLRRFATRHSDWRVPTDPAVRTLLLRQIRRSMPGAVYYAVSGQITVWLIASFGGADKVATVGALGRIAVAFSMLSSVFSLVLVPRFARIATEERARIGTRYWQMQGFVLLTCCMPIGILAMAPHTVLSILGPRYADLTLDALLSAGVGAVAVMNAAALGLAAARGVVTPPWLSIPYALAGQLALMSVLPVSTVSGVLWLGLLSGASQWALTVTYFARKL